jgi:CheY-like chemotaxis protein
LKILVVEDDADVMQLLSRLLGTLGSVQLARDGIEALEAIARGFTPDVVVTDLMMPRMDGTELTRRLKADPNTKSIPIVMLTAKNTPRDVVSGINAGARQYVTKPFKAEELLAKVKLVVGRK